MHPFGVQEVSLWSVYLIFKVCVCVGGGGGGRGILFVK